MPRSLRLFKRCHPCSATLCTLWSVPHSPLHPYNPAVLWPCRQPAASSGNAPLPLHSPPLHNNLSLCQMEVVRGYLHCHKWAQLCLCVCVHLCVCVCVCVCAGWWFGGTRWVKWGIKVACVFLWAHACCLSPVACQTWQHFMFSAYNPWHFTDWHWNQSTLNCGFAILKLFSLWSLNQVWALVNI